jgi:hypothetical protein
MKTHGAIKQRLLKPFRSALPEKKLSRPSISQFYHLGPPGKLQVGSPFLEFLSRRRRVGGKLLWAMLLAWLERLHGDVVRSQSRRLPSRPQETIDETIDLFMHR